MTNDTPKPRYAKLTGWRRSFLGYSSIWRGEDHLLLIRSTGYSEEYRRFYFADIQAVILRKTGRWIGLGIGLGIPTLFCVLGIASNFRDSTGAAVGFGIAAAVFGIPLIINLVLGPSCVCHVQTAVQREELTPWSRIRRAERGLQMIRPLIEQAQGRLAEGEIGELLRGTAATATAPGATPSTTAKADSLPSPPADSTDGTPPP